MELDFGVAKVKWSADVMCVCVCVCVYGQVFYVR